jgi:hypothetical protein
VLFHFIHAIWFPLADLNIHILSLKSVDWSSTVTLWSVSVSFLLLHAFPASTARSVSFQDYVEASALAEPELYFFYGQSRCT